MKAKQRGKTHPASSAKKCKWHDMNRKQRRETMRKLQSEDLSLEVIHPNAAGNDIGNESHYVAVPQKRGNEPVRRFGCTTAELKSIADWLKQCGIRTVAMKSTGVYWILTTSRSDLQFQHPETKSWLKLGHVIVAAIALGGGGGGAGGGGAGGGGGGAGGGGGGGGGAGGGAIGHRRRDRHRDRHHRRRVDCK